jgi:hypothetical protein
VKQVFIHVGYPKCASTYLQKTVFPKLGNFSNMAFAPRDEKYYPLRNDFDPAEFLRIVEKNIINRDAAKEHLILSCEDWVELLAEEFQEVLFEFSGLDRAAYRFSNEQISRNLKAAYPEAQILFVLRDPVSYVVSRYKMLYRGAKTSKPITAFLERPTEGYDQALQHYRELFGTDRVRVLPFELIRSNPAEFVTQITTWVDPDAQISASEEKINAAPDLRSTVEYERLKKIIRFRLEKNGRSPLARIAYILARGWLTAVVRRKLKTQYGNEVFEVTVPPDAAKNFQPLEGG